MLKYAGIGSRETPMTALHKIAEIALYLVDMAILRTGGCEGADMFFYSHGQMNCELYLPWHGYNGHMNYHSLPTAKAIDYSMQFHPCPEKLTQGGKKLHGRNAQILLGHDLNDPVDFVVCWHNDTGGTMQGVRIAQANNIPVFNIRNVDELQALREYCRKSFPKRKDFFA